MPCIMAGEKPACHWVDIGLYSAVFWGNFLLFFPGCFCFESLCIVCTLSIEPHGCRSQRSMQNHVMCSCNPPWLDLRYCSRTPYLAWDASDPDVSPEAMQDRKRYASRTSAQQWRNTHARHCKQDGHVLPTVQVIICDCPASCKRGKDQKAIGRHNVLSGVVIGLSVCE